MNRFWLFIIVLIAFTGCEEDDSPDLPTDNFDRQAMLADWADQIIIPAYTAFTSQTELLKTATESFEENPTASQFTEVKEAYWQTYRAWQEVSMFEIGKAGELQLRDFINIYPTDIEGIMENISSESYNLELPSQRDKQGFAALDYLLYGLSEEETDVLAYYTTRENAAAYRTYLTTLVSRIDELAAIVLASWTSGYRDEFVNNSGNSATASVDRLVNDYIFHYEKALRAGKVGIPAGVFSGTPLPTHVEALYRGEGGKELLLTAVNASNDFFVGKAYGKDNEITSLKDYLDYLDTSKDGQALSTLISLQFEAARLQAESLNDNLGLQVEEDNTLMLRTYDELQKNVVLLKVDMLQALNINVDYVDADGD
jgi:hypothetical protein